MYMYIYVQCTYIYYQDIPTAAPTDLKADTFNGSSAVVSWSPPPPQHRSVHISSEMKLQTTLAPEAVASVTRELTFGTRHWSNPVLAPEERFWRPFFVRSKKIIWIKSMEHKLLKMFQVTIVFHTDEFIFVWSFKNWNGHQNCFSGAKTGLLRREGAKT